MNHILISLVLFNFLGQLVTCSDVSKVSAASTSFSQQLYQKLAKDESSIVYSPYSIHSILALAYYGAGGSTAVQMGKTLFLGSIDSSATAKAYQKIIEQMTSVENIDLYSANALYVKPNFKINSKYSKVAQEYYFARTVNFNMGAPGGPEKVINDFVAEKTQNTINDILPQGTINADTVLLLVNAVYFSGKWETQFNPSLTEEQNFNRLNGVTSQVQMMYAKAIDVDLKQDDDRGVDTISLPFSNPRFSLHIVLPREVDGISNLEEQIISASDVDALLDNLVKTKVTLSLPKFKIETSESLAPVLIEMGMEKAFDNHANFSRITHHHLVGSLTKSGSQAGEIINTEESVSHRNMEGPRFYCAYLGFTALSKPPTNLSVLQSTVKELYFKYRKSPASGRSANLKLVQNGVLVVLYENGSVKSELFLDFSSVTFVEAAKFLAVKTSSERKPKAMFVPVDESKGAVSDKNAFLVDKIYHFLISSTHPPLVVCVVRRPTGVKALDCHVFALDTIENSLHISSLIASAQMPSGPMVKLDSGGDLARAKGGFDRGARGDVIRTDYGEYSVYRGPQNYDTPPSQRYSGGPVSEPQPSQWYGGGSVQSPGRNGHQAPPTSGAPGPIMLTQENFREQPSPTQPYNAVPTTKGYGMYEQSNYGGPPGGYLRQPDVIMQTRQQSIESIEHPSHDHIFNQLQQGSTTGIQMRHEEVSMRNNATNRLSSGPANENRMSGGQIPVVNRVSASHVAHSGQLSPRPNDLTASGYLGGVHYTQRLGHPTSPPVSPLTSMNSPRSPLGVSQKSPRGFDQRDGFGLIFSASNLESRGKAADLDPPEHNVGTRPVAKVPPHMIGVKVLPSDFRMVKLKPKSDKRQDSSESDVYDNTKEILGKHEIPEQHAAKDSNYPEGDAFRDFSGSKDRYNDRNKDFLSQWNDTVKDHKIGVIGNPSRFEEQPSDVYRYGAPRDFTQFEDNNNKNRFSSPVYIDDSQHFRNWGQRSQLSYEHVGNPSQSDDPYARTKDLEIANMFSNVRLQQNSANQDMYRQPRNINEFEDGLGYLP